MVISRLLDTNTVAELAKNVPNESVIEQIKRHDQELAIASNPRRCLHGNKRVLD